MAVIRNSKQRDAIKQFLKTTDTHPTAEAVYENIKTLYPNISLGTVYRNLNFIVEHGEAIRIDCGDGVVHFDGCVKPHYHFYCDKCSSLIDIEMDSVDHINLIAGAGFDGIIKGHTLFFNGICPKCLESE